MIFEIYSLLLALFVTFQEGDEQADSIETATMACMAPSGKLPGCNHNETLVGDLAG